MNCWRLLQIIFADVLASACLEAEGGHVGSDGIVEWTVLRYGGPPGTASGQDLLDGSVPHNSGVASQIEFVLEHNQGWQRTGVDFRRHIGGDSAGADIIFLITAENQLLCEQHAGCAGPELINGKLVCLILATNEFRGNYLVNHEVGHCLGLDHLHIPGVMTYNTTQVRTWPSDEEIAEARANLD